MSALPPKPYGIGSRGRSPAPGSETNTIDQIQIRNTIMIYSIPIETGGERCLNHVIHQFLIHTHWIILSILLILSINTINNLLFLFYIHIVMIRYVLCIRYIPSAFSQLARHIMLGDQWPEGLLMLAVPETTAHYITPVSFL